MEFRNTCLLLLLKKSVFFYITSTKIKERRGGSAMLEPIIWNLNFRSNPVFCMLMTDEVPAALCILVL